MFCLLPHTFSENSQQSWWWQARHSAVTSPSTALCAQVTHVSLAATKALCSSVAVPVPWLRQPSAEGALLAVGVGRVFPAVISTIH